MRKPGWMIDGFELGVSGKSLFLFSNVFGSVRLELAFVSSKNINLLTTILSIIYELVVVFLFLGGLSFILFILLFISLINRLGVAQELQGL